jgi:hypothetical protein
MADAPMLRHVSIELTNRCDKACAHCYNRSRPDGETRWTVPALLAFVGDLAGHGVAGVSLGGGEPLEFPGLIELLEGTRGRLVRSLTTNGRRLAALLPGLARARPERVQRSVHDEPELAAALDDVRRLEAAGLPAGLNLLVRRGDEPRLQAMLERIAASGLGPDRVVVLPMRLEPSPEPSALGRAARRPFLSTTCLLGCAPSARFASVRWDGTVAACSYTAARAALPAPTHAGLVAALSEAGHCPCGPSVPLGRVTEARRLTSVPVAHSMDTEWFAVDEDGFLAELQSGEAGAVPSAHFESERPTDIDQVYRTLIQRGEQGLLLDLDAFAAEAPDGRLYRLSYGGLQEPSGAEPSDTQGLQDWEETLLWLDGPRALAESRGLLRLPTEAGVFALARGDQAELIDALMARGRVKKGWRDFMLGAGHLGLYQYQHMDWYENTRSGPYDVRARPRAPLNVRQLSPRAAALLDPVALPLRFAEANELQPLESQECQSWQRVFVPAYQSEELHLRPEGSGQQLRLPPGRADVHVFIAAAAAVLPEGRRPAGPFHASGPMPVLDSLDKVRLADWALGIASRSAGRRRPPLVSAVRRMVVDLLAATGPAPAAARAPSDAVAAQLERLGASGPGDSPVEALARAVARAAGHARRGDEPQVADEVLRLLAQAAALLDAAPKVEPDGAGFVRALDAEMLRLELTRLTREKLGASIPGLEAVLFRAGEAPVLPHRRGGRCAIAIARTRGGMYGVLLELGGGWRWVEGTRDDVLATVPERWFHAATDALLRHSRG